MHFEHRFVEKRKYTKYYQNCELVDEVLDFFRNNDPKNYSLTDLEKATNIELTVLSKWRKNFQRDPSYRPGGKYGSHRRRFTDVQERAISDFLKIQYVLPGIIVKRKHLRLILFDLWKSFDLESRERITHNFFSNHFISNFCKRNGLSFRQMRKKKRSDLNEEEVKQYAQEFTEVFTTIPWNRILNMDETAWNFVFVRGRVLSITGKEDVDAQLPGDYRQSFTAIATIRADGGKLPPIFLAKGSTNSCEKQFDRMTSDTKDYLLYHSPGGNTDDACMLFYLSQVNKWMNNQPCALILDRYSSHVSESTRRMAERYNIRLIYIPTSATDKFQPLDLRVFGTLKSMAASEFSNHVFSENKGYSQSEAADLFVKCWNKLDRKVIDSAWDFEKHYQNETIEEDEDDTLFSPHDSEYDSEEDAFDEAIDDQEVRLVQKANKEPRLTPPRKPMH